MKETSIQDQIRLKAATNPGTMLFRNNVGQAWQGEPVSGKSGGANVLILKSPRPIFAGLFKGSADLIGWQEITVTPEMVGRKFAVFLSVEVKRDPKQKLKPEQDKWKETVSRAGGIAMVATSPDDLINQIKIYEAGEMPGKK